MSDHITYNSFYFQLVRFSSVCSKFNHFDISSRNLLESLLNRGFSKYRLKNGFRKFVLNHHDLLDIKYSMHLFSHFCLVFLYPVSCPWWGRVGGSFFVGNEMCRWLGLFPLFPVLLLIPAFPILVTLQYLLYHFLSLISQNFLLVSTSLVLYLGQLVHQPSGDWSLSSIWCTIFV